MTTTDNRNKDLAQPTIYWTQINHHLWQFYIAASSNGLCYVGSQGQPFAEMETWIHTRRSGSVLVEDKQKLEPYTEQLIQYLQGERQQFTITHDFQGTPFQLQVWQALLQIPYGQTWSYSDIAQHIGRPAAVRAVGAAIGANPFLITIPCHRVIGKGGALTGYRGGLDMKTTLLDLEKELLPVGETI
ncbi:methylated-DNA--[protein]-cysteine S-methyltransferase [Paenibacillus sp. PsM32]|uniref:methylated-DNA--[protein]-cysteine S-methyltransferase n=1 Tax=Paenibacillus sp. PsM32 TaxID=3030536 RepID=UPI00263A6387|nr:methylated-DNA--[protein]-cysteine S-methyltransferase [Paenibacillus sp. PsM32]MDN4617896.1 methylated-DNA--[protein]-cysteine S-methyltransferase [Paenibacillus sp. PsM32]